MSYAQVSCANIIHDRFGAFAELSLPEISFLERMFAASSTHAAGAKLISAGSDFDKPRVILSGWAFSAVTFADGRRQIVDFYLPGDIVGFCSRAGARAHASYFALTRLVSATAHALAAIPRKREAEFPALAKACLAIEEQQELRHVTHIVRLGRQLARERMASLILDLSRRLRRCGLEKDGVFDMPVTQEVLGDALGLSTVHVNRTLQELRHAGLIRTPHGKMEILDAARLSAIAGFPAAEAA